MINTKKVILISTLVASVICTAVCASALASANPEETDPKVIYDADDLSEFGLNAIAVSDVHKIGYGAWQNYSDGIKFEWYLPLNELPWTFTIDDIESITYSTLKDDDHVTNPPDFYVSVYTKGIGDAWWFKHRLNTEPYLVNNLDETAGAWNTWSTDEGTNQLTFCDSNRSGVPQGFYGQPTLQDLQDGSINWHDYNPAYEDKEIDYGPETVKFLVFATGSGWDIGFDGYLDDIEITIKGVKYVLDLEDFVPETAVTVTPDYGVGATTVQGENFIGNSQMTIKWDDKTLPTFPSVVSSDENGRFTAIVSVFYEVGEHTIKAIDDEGHSGEATYTVPDLNGKDGKDGIDGIDGNDGKDGVDGENGENGINGKDGIDGIDGADGIDGKDGIDGENGAIGPQGPPGENVGIQGPQGENGAVGPQGERGPEGGSGAATAAALAMALVSLLVSVVIISRKEPKKTKRG